MLHLQEGSVELLSHMLIICHFQRMQVLMENKSLTKHLHEVSL